MLQIIRALWPIESLKLWWRCGGQDQCCCAWCCDYCLDAYFERRLTPEYAAERMEKLQRFALRAMAIMRVLLTVLLLLGIAGLIAPAAVMKYPSRSLAAVHVVVSSFYLYIFSIVKTKATE